MNQLNTVRFYLRSFKWFRSLFNVDWYNILVDADQQWPAQEAQFYWITGNEFFKKFNYDLFETIENKNIFPQITSNFVYDFEPLGYLLTECWCTCGQRLNASGSFCYETYVENTEQFVFKYQCTFCNRISYFNPDIIPGLMPCDEFGIPYNAFSSTAAGIYEDYNNVGNLITNTK